MQYSNMPIDDTKSVVTVVGGKHYITFSFFIGTPIFFKQWLIFCILNCPHTSSAFGPFQFGICSPYHDTLNKFHLTLHLLIL